MSGRDPSSPSTHWSTLVFDHTLQLSHARRPLAAPFGVAASHSDVEVDAHSQDLVEAWRELLSRLPTDVYAALKQAMGHGQG